MTSLKTAVLAAALMMCAGMQSASAATYYVDPAAGAIGNDGSAGSPWNTFSAVMTAKTFSAGDTVLLLSGDHGSGSITASNSGTVVVKAADGAVPVMHSLLLDGADYWEIDGITFKPANPAADGVQLFELTEGSIHNTVKNCSLYTLLDASGWNAANWGDRSCSAIKCNGSLNSLHNNYMKNVAHGLRIGRDADSCVVTNNTVMNFCKDGMRGLGDYGVFEYNVVKNSYFLGDGHHDDIWQSYSTDGGVGKGTVVGIVLRGNYFLHHDGTVPAELLGVCQGIGCFDGMFVDWLVENNMVSVDHFHGITLMGATNCTIINNTIIQHPKGTRTTWIQIDNHKNNTASSGNVVRNNICSLLDVVSNTVADHNVAGSFVRAYLNDWANYDFTPKPGAAALIDAGSADGAPSFDILGNPRPVGAGIDIGCYEYDAAGIVAGYRPPQQRALASGQLYNMAGQPVSEHGAATGMYLRYDAHTGTMQKTMQVK